MTKLLLKFVFLLQLHHHTSNDTVSWYRPVIYNTVSWYRPVVYNAEDFIYILDGHKWQDWTKDLNTHK